MINESVPSLADYERWGILLPRFRRSTYFYNQSVNTCALFSSQAKKAKDLPFILSAPLHVSEGMYLVEHIFFLHSTAKNSKLAVSNKTIIMMLQEDSPS